MKNKLKIFVLLFTFFTVQYAFSQVSSVNYWPIDPQTLAPVSMSAFNGDYDGLQADNPPVAFPANGIRIEAVKGTIIKSVSDGIVAQNDLGDVVIVAAQGDPTGWEYGHIDPDPLMSAGKAVTAGQVVGKTSGFAPTNDPTYVHFLFARSYSDNVGDLCYQNPLAYYWNGLNPSLMPSMEISFSAQNIQFVQDFDPTSPSATVTPFTGTVNGKPIVYGSVDAIVDPHTVTQGDPNPGVNSLGFSVVCTVNETISGFA